MLLSDFVLLVSLPDAWAIPCYPSQWSFHFSFSETEHLSSSNPEILVLP